MPGYESVGQSRNKMGNKTYAPAEFVGRAWMNNASFNIVTSLVQLESILDEFLLMDTEVVAFDTETTGLDHFTDVQVGFSFCFKPFEGYYVPVRHRFYEDNVDPKEAMALISDKLRGSGKRIAFFNLEYDIDIMLGDNFTYLNPEGDTPLKNELNHELIEEVQILAFLHEPNFNRPSLKGTSIYCLGFEMFSYEETVLGKPADKISKTDRKKLPSMDLVDPEDSYVYACSDAIITYQLYLALSEFVNNLGMKRSYMIVKESICRFRQLTLTAIPMNVPYLANMREYVSEAIEQARNNVFEMAGGTFTINSTRELAQRLLEAGVPLVEKTKTGQYSTAEGVLSAFKGQYDIIDELIDYRHLLKQSGFLDALEKYWTFDTSKEKHDLLDIPVLGQKLKEDGLNLELGPAGFVLIQYNNLSIPTLRLSSGGKSTIASGWNQINYQQMPKFKLRPAKLISTTAEKNIIEKLPFIDDVVEGLYVCDRCDDEGKLVDCSKIESCALKGNCTHLEEEIEFPKLNTINFRRMYSAYPNHIFMNADYAAEEIMLAIYYSGEKIWLKALDDSVDLHKVTASRVFNTEYDSVTTDMRKLAKTATFLLLYGGTADGLARSMNIPFQQADQIVRGFFAGLPDLDRWIETQKRVLRETSFIKNPFGYKRPMHCWINSGNPPLIRYAERSAVNTFIQSTAGFVMRIAICRLYRKIRLMGLEKFIIPIGSVHDELSISVHKSIVPYAAKLLTWAMTDFDLPNLPNISKGRRLKAEPAIGNTWGQLVDISENVYNDVDLERDLSYFLNEAS